MFDEAPLLTFDVANLRVPPAGYTVTADSTRLLFRPRDEQGAATAETSLDGIDVLSLEQTMSDICRLASFATYNTVRWQGWSARGQDGSPFALERKGRTVDAYRRSAPGLAARFDAGERGAVPTPELGEFISAAIGPYQRQRETLRLPLTLLLQATLFSGPPEARVMLLSGAAEAFKARTSAAAGRTRFLEEAAYDRVIADSGLARLFVHLLKPLAPPDVEELLHGIAAVNRRSSDLVLQRLLVKHDVREVDDEGVAAVPFRLQPFLALRDAVLCGSPGQVDPVTLARVCDRTEFALHALVFRLLGFLLEWSVDQGALQFEWRFDDELGAMARIY